MDTTRRLYQFPLSLYCEKTQWNLDHKQLAWQPVNLLPGMHVPLAWWLARQRTLPILDDGHHRGDSRPGDGRRVGDSTRIALYLEEKYPALPLLPADPALRREVLALEDYFDEVGDHVRRSVWSLAIDSPRVTEIFFHGYDARQQRIGHLMRPLLRLMIRFTFSVWPARVTASWAEVDKAMAAVEKQLKENGTGYLVGDRFTLADLTAACMLAPLIGPAESPWPDERVAVAAGSARDIIRQRPAARWVLETYAKHRARPQPRQR